MKLIDHFNPDYPSTANHKFLVSNSSTGKSTSSFTREVTDIAEPYDATYETFINLIPRP